MKSSITLRFLAITAVTCSSLSAETVEVEEKATVATRLIGDDVDGYLSGVRAKLAINTKDRGPFGLYQKPGKEPKKPLLTPRKRKDKPVEIPFAAVIDALPVAAVMAGDRKFMVGARAISVGQTIPLVAGGRTTQARVESVTKARITFRNLATNEVAVKRLDLLPEGVRPGGGAIVPDGVQRERDGVIAPFEVHPGLPPEPSEN